jgi:hypothetical protein
MKKIVIFVGLMVGLCGDTLHMKINGKKEDLSIRQDGANYISNSTQNKFRYQNTSDILVEFYKITPELITSFEGKYNLKRKKIMVIGYYVYKIEGNINEVVKQISNEANVKTVKPDLAMTIIFY